MELKAAFGKVLNWVRVRGRFTQEDFSVVSSRTYISTLERGIYSPTLEKLEDISSVLKIHPATLLVGSYAAKDGISVDEILARVKRELEEWQIPEAAGTITEDLR